MTWHSIAYHFWMIHNSSFIQTQWGLHSNYALGLCHCNQWLDSSKTKVLVIAPDEFVPTSVGPLSSAAERRCGAWSRECAWDFCNIGIFFDWCNLTPILSGCVDHVFSTSEILNSDLWSQLLNLRWSYIHSSCHASIIVNHFFHYLVRWLWTGHSKIRT